MADAASRVAARIDWIHAEEYKNTTLKRTQRPPLYILRTDDKKVFTYGSSNTYEGGRDHIPVSETNTILYGSAEGFLVSRESAPEVREGGLSLSGLVGKIIGASDGASGK